MSKSFITILADDLKRANFAYYESDSPIYTNEQYDQKRQLLKVMLQNNPEERFETAMGILDTVGTKPTGENKVPHKIKMLSLQNAYTEDDLTLWDYKVNSALGQPPEHDNEYFIESKIDGMSFSALYIHGELTQASTRGDGDTGQDITENFKQISNMPNTITYENFPDTFEVRGEIVMSKINFQALNVQLTENGQKPLKNARNATAGTIMQHDPQLVAERGLMAICYDVGVIANDNENIMDNIVKDEVATRTLFDTQLKMIRFFEDCELPVDRWSALCVGLNDAKTHVTYLTNSWADFPYECDGVVLKVNNFYIRDAMGDTVKYPRWAIAKKPTSKKAFTWLQNIILQVSGTGTVTPVGEVLPVELHNSKISKCTLHNKNFIKDNDIRIGDLVEIEMAGEVVPEIIGRDISCRSDSSVPYEFPDNCPACNSPLIIRESPRVTCINPTCTAIMKGNILKFVSRSALNIRGLKVVTIDKLFELNLLKNTQDLFKLSRYREILYKQNGFGELSVNKLLNEIEEKKYTSFERFIIGLGIPQVNKSTSRIIANRFYSPEDFFYALDNLLEGEPINLPSVGKVVSNELFKYWELKKDYVRELYNLIEITH